jgi:hypothetical protein
MRAENSAKSNNIALMAETQSARRDALRGQSKVNHGQERWRSVKVRIVGAIYMINTAAGRQRGRPACSVGELTDH